MACRLPRNVCTYLPDYTASHPATRAILYVCDVAVFDWFCHVATLFLSVQRLELAIYCVQITSTHFCSYRLYRHSSVRLSPSLPSFIRSVTRYPSHSSLCASAVLLLFFTLSVPLSDECFASVLLYCYVLSSRFASHLPLIPSTLLHLSLLCRVRTETTNSACRKICRMYMSIGVRLPCIILQV